MIMDDDAIRPVGASESYPVIISSGKPPLSGSGKRRRRDKAQSDKGGHEKEGQPVQEGHVDRYV